MEAIQDQQLTVKKLQAAFRSNPVHSVLKLQDLSALKPPARGDVWISQDLFSAPMEDDLRDVLYDVVEAHQTKTHRIPPRLSIRPSSVSLEWIGQRKNLQSREPQAGLSDEDIYKRLCQDVERPMTILYVHGGSFYWGGPGMCRLTTGRLASLTGARVVCISYRLAPQHPFPTALLDLLVAWMSLLHPPGGARHAPVSPESVVLAGDSAGGNLCLALVQMILRMKEIRDDTHIRFNGRRVEIPLPAGVSLLSPFADLSLNLPSWHRNGHVDILQEIQPVLGAIQPADEVWPTDPPRGDPYCESLTWTHVLASPVVAESWKGAPPIWIAVGEERCADGGKFIASRAAQQGVPVFFSEYMGLPHIFAPMLSKLPQSKRCYEDWAGFCVACYDSGGKRDMKSQGMVVFLPGDVVRSVRVENVSKYDLNTITELVGNGARNRRPWTGPAVKL